MSELLFDYELFIFRIQECQSSCVVYYIEFALFFCANKKFKKRNFVCLSDAQLYFQL